MSTDQSDIVEVGEKLALICDDGPQTDTLKSTAEELGFKAHTAETSERGIERMKYAGYDLIIVTEGFSGSTLESNGVLRYLAPLPMAQRRDWYVVLIGESFRTLDAMQAYSQSVHLVVNPQDVSNLGAILRKGLADFQMFYRVYKSVLVETGEVA